jgi:hypothetical protein
MTMALTPIWNVFPLAMLIGWPLKDPNQVLRPALSIRSGDTIDHVPPEEFVHESAVVAGKVTLLPAELAVDCVLRACPPAVYPVPVNSVPAALAEDAVDARRIFIAPAPNAVHVPGTPAAPTGVVALSILLAIA